MHIFTKIIGLMLVVFLTACGGGGGSAGTTAGGTGVSGTTTTPTGGTSTTTVVLQAVVTLQLLDANGAATTTVGSSAPVFARATLRNAAGAPVSGQIVTLTSPGGLVRFLPSAGTAITDASGAAVVQVLPALATASGAGTLFADAVVAGALATAGSINFAIPINTAVGPSISLGLRNASNASTNIVDRNGTTSARVLVANSSGTPVAGALVAFSANAALLQFSPANGAVVSDANGIATIQVSPASISAAGAGTLNVGTSVGGVPIADAFSYQLAATTSAGVPTLVLGLFNGSNASTNSVEASGVTTAKATLLDASGAPVSGKIVSFSADAGLVKLNPASGQVLTNTSGVASIQISPASLFAAGAGTLNTVAAIGAVSLATAFDYQLSAANVGLQTLDVGTTPLAAFGNRPVSVVATINGAPAVNTPIQISFSASCGLISPATITTDSTGKAAVTYSANVATCAGTNVNITAAAVGATPLSGTVAVQASQATNVQFVSATPQLIYLKESVGATQSQVKFKVVDSGGNSLQNQALSLTLQNAAPGISINVDGNTAPVTLTSDASGEVSVAVFSGTVPTSAVIRATLVSNPSVFAISNVLAVASGLPVQSRASLALSKLSIEGLNLDGDTSQVTMSLADRQGNPVPDGTQVNFVTQAGVMVPPTCIVAGGSSQCTVAIRAQGTRPVKGRIAILAYVPGEEDFIDANFNNAYDPGEAFTDLGNAFRDDFAASGFTDGAYTAGEFSVLRGTAPVACTGGINGRLNTCDGVWGKVEVRVQATIIFADRIPVYSNQSFATSTILVGTRTVVSFNAFSADVADLNGNSLPTSTSIAAAATSVSGSCAATAQSTVIPNTLGSTPVVVTLSNCVAGDVLRITTKTPLGAAVVTPFTLM